MEFSVVSRLENGAIIAEVTAPEADKTTQYAYYLYEKTKGVLEKRMYTGETVCSFQPPSSGQYYVRAFVRSWPDGLQKDPVTVAKNSNTLTYYLTKSIPYERLNGERFRSTESTIYDILWNGVHFEFCIHYKPESTRAVILGTEDVGGTKFRPSFDRISWAKELPGTAIYYYDPTIYLGESTVGWGYGTNDRWYLEDIAYLLHTILTKLGISAENTLFYGSSAGGYMSMCLAAMLESRATVINPQFIVENFWPRLVERFKQSCLKEGEHLLPERTHAASVFQNENYFPPLHIIQNIRAERDVQTQLTPFLASLCSHPVDCGNRLNIEFYADDGGHGAMPSKETCLLQIEEDLSRPLPQSGELSPAPVGSFRHRLAAGLVGRAENVQEAWTAEDDEKLYLIITIDTEDKYENVPNLFECDFGDEGNCGVNYIMDQTEKRGMRCVFFTNIYEHDNFHGAYEGYMENLVKRISSRGHEVALHTHEDGNQLDFYQKPLYACDYEEQRKILQYGTDFIEKHTGKRPISHRGGGYRCNETTFQVLSDLGYRIESSSFYGNIGGSGNRFPHFRSLNQPVSIEGLIEFPVVAVFDQKGALKKFDINQLNEKALIAAVEQMKERRDFNAVQFMFHSFSFLDQKGKEGLEPKFYVESASSSHAGYGVHPGLMKRFETFLDYLRDDPRIEVVTFEQYLAKKAKLPPIWGDGPFHADTEEAKKVALSFAGVRKNPRFLMKNTYRAAGDSYPSCDFDSCFLPRPKLYMAEGKMTSYADDLMNGKLWVYPRIEPMPYALETLDFGVQFSNIPRTFQLYLQAFNPVQILVCAYEKGRNPSYLEFAWNFIRKWEAYADLPANASSNPFVFNDHVVALRAENLMYFGQICSKVGIWSDDLYHHLNRLLTQHGEWLFDDAHYTKRHNHGVMQDQALLHLGYVLDRKDWMEHAKERLLAQEKWAFNEEMVHTENSPGYANGVAVIFRSIGQFLSQNGDPLGEQLVADMEKTREFIGWTIKPNGIVAQVGDTGNSPGQLYASPEKMRRHTPEEHKIYPLAGYYFYRSNRDEAPKQDTWKLLKCGYVQTTHKHADDASFMLYAKGYEIFSDGGIYGYAKDPFRAYFVSALAHNTVVVDGASYPCDKAHVDACGMSGYAFFPDYDHIRVFHNAYEGVGFQRDFCSADDMTLILDTLSSEQEHTYSQLFHLAENVEVLLAKDREVVLRLADSGYIVRLRQYGAPAKLSVMRGDLKKAGYGLISRGENHMAAITTLKFDLSGKNGVFATAITIEDADGFVRLGGRKARAEDLRYDASTQTFMLGTLTIPCTRPLPEY